MPRKKGEWEEARAAFLGIQGKERTFRGEGARAREGLWQMQALLRRIDPWCQRGDCLKLKTGSDISVDPPVYVVEGATNLQTEMRMDASRCQHFEEMEIVDKDISEAFDPRYSRYQRQMLD